MPPPWLLTIPAWLTIAADLVSAAAILYGIYKGGRQPVRIMEAVPPIQIGMMIGLATSYRTNIVLIRNGVKHAMHRPVLAAAAAR